MVGSIYRDGTNRIKVIGKDGKLFNCVQWFKGEKTEVDFTKQQLENKELICVI